MPNLSGPVQPGFVFEYGPILVQWFDAAALNFCTSWWGFVLGVVLVLGWHLTKLIPYTGSGRNNTDGAVSKFTVPWNGEIECNVFTKAFVVPFYSVVSRRASRLIGKALLTFFMWYSTAFPLTDEAYACTCLLVFVDRVVIWSLVKIVGKLAGRRSWAELWGEFCSGSWMGGVMGADETSAHATDDGGSDTKTEPFIPKSDGKEFPLVATNVYMDFTTPLHQTVFVCVSQVILLGYYTYELVGLNAWDKEAGAPNDDDPGALMRHWDDRGLPVNVSMLKWLVAVLIGSSVGESVIGTAFDWRFWSNARSRSARFGAIISKWEARYWGQWPHISLRYRLLLRFSFDAIINSVFLEVILLTSPILLSVEEPLDYVKDVTALFFIVTLDDLEGSKDLCEHTTWRDRYGKRPLEWTASEEALMILCETQDEPGDSPGNEPGAMRASDDRTNGDTALENKIKEMEKRISDLEGKGKNGKTQT